MCLLTEIQQVECKKQIFNREALRDVQEDLPKHLHKLNFDIERGQKGSERKNLSMPEFKEMKQEQQVDTIRTKTKKKWRE